MDKFLLLIDGSSLLSTQYYGNLPTEILFARTEEEKAGYYHKIMQTSSGVYTNAVFGFLRTLLKILKEQKPDYLAVAWDLGRNTFRRELYADYKGNRGETPLPLKDQFALCREVLERMGIRQFMDERYEADDFCGSLARAFENEVPVKILTKDNDYLQLVTARTNLWMMHATAKKTDELYQKYHIARDDAAAERSFNFTPELVEAEFGVKPASIADLKGLQGDSSDNIKGVPGVGPQTAVALIAKYLTVEALYEAMEGLDDKGLKELAASWKAIGVSRSPINSLLKEDDTELVGRRAAFLSKRLATIKCDIELDGLTLDSLSVNIDREETIKVFGELEFKSLKAELGTSEQEGSSVTYTVTSDLSEVESLVGELMNSGTETGKAGKRRKYAGFSVLGTEGQIYGIALTTDKDRTLFIKAENFITGEYLSDMLIRLDDAGVVLVGFDIKSILKCLGCSGFFDAFDAALAEYIINPLEGDYEYSEVLSRVTQKHCESAQELIGKQSIGEAWKNNNEKAIRMAAAQSSAAYECYLPLDEKLKCIGSADLFYRIEMPLVYTLYGMERKGILVDKDALKELGASLNESILQVEREIYDYVGEEFNINSPKQLGVILFEKLRLPYGKKTKTGYSTSAEVLEKLKPEDPVIEKILNYRQLTKLKSTYADGLYDFIGEDGRIRTTFNQMVTATGRLSSTEPNLQNIPIRMEMGRQFRKVFVAPEGYVLVDADYSQIELRILASMSGDPKLIDAYRNSEDIHRVTASQVFKVPFEEVTPTLRSRAKAVNFGIVYGISSFGLGNGLNIPRKEAEEYIAAYFETYPRIKSFLDGLVSEAVSHGYAVTEFGRRRPIPELNSSNYMNRQFGERVAMNSPIQGTAADIIKLAMLKVDTRLRRECPEASLILQVHDELLVEAPKNCEELVKKILDEEMRGAADMKVELETGILSGSNWLEAH